MSQLAYKNVKEDYATKKLIGCFHSLLVSCIDYDKVFSGI